MTHRRIPETTKTATLFEGVGINGKNNKLYMFCDEMIIEIMILGPLGLTVQ